MKAFIAEFIGTFTLVFVSVGAIINEVDLIGVALAYGMAMAVMVAATAFISGGQLNPAISIGLLFAGKQNLFRTIFLIIAQCLGATAGAAILYNVFPEQITAGMGTPIIAESLTLTQALIIEGTLTFLLMFVVYGTAIDYRSPRRAGLFIGLTVALGAMIALPLTGGALNPARHLGSALMPYLMNENLDFLNQAWIYWTGPAVGAIIASLLWAGLLEERPDEIVE